MSIITAVGTSVPSNLIGQERAKEFTRALFRNSYQDIERLLVIFDNALIERRHVSAPLDWYGADHTFSEKNRCYLDSALKIGREAISSCLAAAELEPGDVDHFIFVSTTGLSTPSVDAHLANCLKMRKDIRRTPIWGLGCAGGAAGLSRAFEFTRAFPAKRALVLALELCSLTFQKDDLSKSNLVASSLFADGAAAVLVSGTETGASGPVIVGTRSTLWYDSLDVMGWEINDQGMKVLFSRDIPSIVRNCVLPNVLEFLDGHGLGLSDLEHIIAHPGGAKVLEAYRETLRLTNGKLDIARSILQNYGNMSSPTVLFVLDEFLRSGVIGPGEHGLITALGPGFSSEMLLVRG